MADSHSTSNPSDNVDASPPPPSGKPNLKIKFILVLIGLVFAAFGEVRRYFFDIRSNLSLATAAVAREVSAVVAYPAEQNQEFIDGFSTPSVQCRLGLEQWQNENIDWWMKNPPYPLVEWIWELTDPKTNRTYYKGYLHVLLCGKGSSSCSQNRAQQIMDMNWNWQDQNGDTHAIPAEAMHISHRWRPKILFRLDPPNPSSKPSKLWPTLGANATKDSNDTNIPVVYDLEPYLNCSTVEKQHPPPRAPKIGACVTRFWGIHHLTHEWIAYHRMVGIQHFYFFVQEPFEHILPNMPRYEAVISYIPYNYTWAGHHHNGNEDMLQSKGGSGRGWEAWFQNPAANQCLNLAKQHGLECMLTPDVDEWLVVRDPSIEHHFGAPGQPSPLQQYFDKNYGHNQHNNRSHPVTQVCLTGAQWGRHPTQLGPKNNGTLSFQSTLDFTYRKDRNYGNGQERLVGFAGAGGRKKCFYNVSEVEDVWVHGHLVSPPFQVTNTSESYASGEIANASLIEQHHYRSLIKGQWGIAKPNELVSYPEFRDQYRAPLVAEMKRLNWSLPEWGSQFPGR